MRKRRAPFEGYTQDNDMVAFWRCNDGTSATIQSEVLFSGAIRHLSQISTATVSPVSSLFSGEAAGALRFNNAFYRAFNAASTDDSSVTQADFSLALWYDFGSISSTVTLGVLGYAVTTTVTTDQRQLLGLYYDVGAQQFYYSIKNNGVTTVLNTSPVIPTYGHLALSVTSAASVSWYSNGRLIKTDSFTDSRSSVTSASGRWSIGGDNGGIFDATFRLNNATLDEIAVWNRSISAEKVRELYAACVRPWDQQTLEDTNNQRTIVRVLIADSTGKMVDVTNLCNRNWLLSADISESVDDPAISASVVLARRNGVLLDLAPLNEPAYRAILEDNITAERLVDFRRRITIERAVIPNLWTVQGWEWELRFDGFIDAWDVDEDTITLACIDKSAPLIDQFILDQKAYNFYTANKQMESHLQEIVNDNNPAIVTDTSTVTVGYKGGLPVVYTEAGTSASIWLNPANWNLRYNDVASGTVLSALQAVTDQIGALIGYRFHEPWQEYRLETHFPKRSKSFDIRAVAPISGGIEVATYEPHGLNVGSIASIYGTSSLSFGGSVASVLDYYRIRFEGFTGGSTATETVGSLGFRQHVALDAQELFSINPVKSEIANIRNHAIVKFQRVDSLANAPVASVSTSAASSNLVFVSLPSSIDLSAVDPSKLGITFTISDSSVAAFNANYTGSVIGKRLIRSNEPYPPGGTVSTTIANFSCPYVAFQQVASTASSSISKYGLRTVGMYEGSNLAISSFQEASRIADSFIFDLAEPTIDLSITTRVLDLRLGDLIALPNDPKGRWVQSSGLLTPAVVGITERYQSGSCTAEYALRHTRPTAGTRLYDRLKLIYGNGITSNNLHDVVVDMLSLSLQNKLGRMFSYGFPRQDRREMGLRDDTVEIHISTSSGFRPGPDTLVSKGRANHLSITQDGNGNPLTPGTTYFVRFRYLDIYGNPSAITGLNLASAATTPSIYVRYLDQRPEAFVAQTTAGTANVLGTTFTPWQLEFDNAGDAAGRTFDNFNNYSTGSSLWRAPATGHYSITHRSYWLGDGSKTTGFTVVGGVQHLTTATVLGEYSITLASTDSHTNPCRLNITANVFCQSGDFLRVCVARQYRGLGSTAGDVPFIIKTTTATNNFPFTSICMTSES